MEAAGSMPPPGASELGGWSARVVKVNRQRRARGPKMPRQAGQAAAAHLRYLERDGVSRDGGKGRVYSAIENEAGGRAFLPRGREERHQFRFIVPEGIVAKPLGDAYQPKLARWHKV
jgi:type IV secretory pathway VirD2 relaxase